VRVEDGTLATGWLNSTAQSHFRLNVSTDEGATWSASNQVDQTSPGGCGTWSSITTANGSVMAVFSLYFSSWDTYFRSSTDGGRTWVEGMARVDDDATGAVVSDPVVAARSSMQVYAAWRDDRPPGSSAKIYTSRGTHLGATSVAWEPATPVGDARVIALPNPARAGATLRLRILGDSSAGPRTLAIHDASGRLLRRLVVDGGETAWDGRDAGGRVVAPGVYLTRREGGARSAVGKIVLTR
jgi:BNR repeat-like domain